MPIAAIPDAVRRRAISLAAEAPHEALATLLAWWNGGNPGHPASHVAAYLPDEHGRFMNALVEDPTEYSVRDFEERGSCAMLGRALIEFRMVRSMEVGTGSFLAVDPQEGVLRDNPACGVLHMTEAEAVSWSEEALSNVARSRKAH